MATFSSTTCPTRQSIWTVTRLVPAFIGIVVLVAAAAKLLEPAPFLIAIDHVLKPLGLQLPLGYSAAIGVVLIAMEVGLGVSCVISGTLGTRIATALMFLIFGLVLVTRFSGPDAPSCACLGRLLRPDASAVWFDAARNLAFAIALVSVGGQPTPSFRSPTGGRSLAGFTLIEVIVAVLVIAILVAIALPMLGRARQRAFDAESLAANRQIAAVLVHYAGDYREHFPAYKNRGVDSGGPMEIADRAIMVSVLSAHMRYWPAAVVKHDPGALAGLRHPRVKDAPIDPDAPTIEQTFFFLTPAVAAIPEAFTLAPPSPLPASMLRANRWPDVTYPSQKGLVLDTFWKPDDIDAYLASFADGSAAAIPADRTTRVAPLPDAGPHVPVISTLDGLHGRDR